MNSRCGQGWVRACVLAFVFAAALPHTASAGPVELFSSIETASGNPDRLVARWINGDSGIFVSNDKGATFNMACYPAISSTLMGRSVQATRTATDGSQCVGTLDQLFCSNAAGCGWQEQTELKGQWISDFAEDPIDPKRMYLATGTGEGMNGVWVREAPGEAWKQLGTQLPAWFSRIFVTKNGTGRRIYVSSQENVMVEAADGGGPTTVPKYFIRYSDDDAKTWNSMPYGDIPERTNLRLVGVDPTNPDRIVILLLRSAEMAPDDLYYSDKKGETGSFVKIGTITQFSGVTFQPDGTMWYGDNDQDTPALYKVAKLGEAPTKVIASYKVGCVNYDAASERLYVCADWRLGTADLTNGTMTTLFDIRNASTFLECEGEPALSMQCGPALQSPNFCDITHYSAAPVCVKYFGTDPDPFGMNGMGSGGAGGTSAAAGARAAGAGGAGAAGSSAAAGGKAAGSGGSGAGSSAGSGDEKKDSGGCSVGAVGGRGSGSGWLAVGTAFALASFRRKKRRT